MDLRKIKKLIELVEESGIAELEVKSGEEAVRITMQTASGVAPLVNTLPPAGSAVDSSTGSSANSPKEADADRSALASHQDSHPASGQAEGQPLASPLSGTFYAAASPEAQDFVAVGDRVSAGDVVCIVESMKMMNRIEADRSGVVTAALVANGEPVESGQSLFLIDG